ncbi:BspA family leucine-rich repeat surface protein [Apilactobacillus micheneri]|uniref:BspA family leucine-rich repeat surface protein n=1 Tax=Apilactobacillus micheneri TaxID=1899430 RepID=UPI00112EDBC1|nr:BspA family leucine-rich repeat surface protein [Apilactobacillus micheneri]TPR49220.1 BspA family leucine-rich repeat surface protein [Apilactobacillus micheneri]
MLGKNNQDKLQKLSQDQTIKYKLRKKGKQWFNLTLTTTALGIGFFALSTTTIHADVSPNQVVQQTQNNSNPANSDEQHSNHVQSEVGNGKPATHPITTTQTDTADVHTGAYDDANKQADAKDNPTSSSDDKQSENTMSHDSKTITPQVDNQNLKYPSANADNNHEKPDVVSANSKQDNSSSDDSKVINNNAAQPQPSVDDKDKVVAKDELTTQQSTDKNKDTQASQPQSDNTSHSKHEEPTANVDQQQNNNQEDQTNGGQVKEMDTNHQSMTKDDLANNSKDNSVSLLENKLSNQFAGGSHLKLAQMKLAMANNDSNNIPAADANGNYNWNSDQFAAAKAKNAVHSGMWGTAQWFMDKNNNLFIGNGELSNNTNSNRVETSSYNTGSYTEKVRMLNYYDDGSGLRTGAFNNPFQDLSEITNGAISSAQLAPKIDDPYSEYGANVDMYKTYYNTTKSSDEYNVQGLAQSLVNALGNNNFTISSMNLTSTVNLPKDASNLLQSFISSNKTENYDSGIVSYHFIQTYNGLSNMNKDLGTYYDYSHKASDPNNYTQTNSTNNMIINKITGYNNINTGQTENMHNLFGGQEVDPDTSSWDFSNAKDLSSMEAGTHATNLDLSNKDLSKVTDFSNMANTPTLRTANLNNDTISDSSNKANMLNGNVQEVSFNSKDTL